MKFIKKNFIFYNNSLFGDFFKVKSFPLGDDSSFRGGLLFFNSNPKFLHYPSFLNLVNWRVRNNVIYQFLRFSYYRFSFIVGLWFKKKINKKGRLLYLYLGNRHWVIIPIPRSLKIFPVKKRSVIFFSNKRDILFTFISIIKNLRLESSYKIMGIFTVRLFRRWLNVRYIRIKFLVTKKIKNKQSFM